MRSSELPRSKLTGYQNSDENLSKVVAPECFNRGSTVCSPRPWATSNGSGGQFGSRLFSRRSENLTAPREIEGKKHSGMTDPKRSGNSSLLGKPRGINPQ